MLRARIMTMACSGLMLVSGLFGGAALAADEDHPVVILDTTAGTITVELDRTKAPISVDNFLKYVDKGFYDGTVFHRVISDFMIQTGGMTETNNRLKEKDPLFPSIKNEAGNGLSNTRGTLAMARTNDINSATSQFFINRYDTNSRLDRAGGGYAVFGKVTDGMKVVDAIAEVPVTTKVDSRGTPNGDVPVKPVMIKSAKRKS